MVTEAVFDFFLALIGFIVDKLPSFTPPTWLATITEALSTVLAYGQSLGAWVPTTLLATVFTAVIASFGIGFGIKAVRMVLSLFTAGGGSAA